MHRVVEIIRLAAHLHLSEEELNSACEGLWELTKLSEIYSFNTEIEVYIKKLVPVWERLCRRRYKK